MKKSTTSLKLQKKDPGIQGRKNKVLKRSIDLTGIKKSANLGQMSGGQKSALRAEPRRELIHEYPE